MLLEAFLVSLAANVVCDLVKQVAKAIKRMMR